MKVTIKPKSCGLGLSPAQPKYPKQVMQTTTRRTSAPKNINRVFNPNLVTTANHAVLTYKYSTNTNTKFPSWISVITIIQIHDPKSVVVVVKWTGVKTRLRKHELAQHGVIPQVKIIEWVPLCDVVKTLVKQSCSVLFHPFCELKTEVVPVPQSHVTAPIVMDIQVLALTKAVRSTVQLPPLFQVTEEEEDVETVEMEAEVSGNPFDDVLDRYNRFMALLELETELNQDCVDIIEAHMTDIPVDLVVPSTPEPVKETPMEAVVDAVFSTDTLLTPHHIEITHFISALRNRIRFINTLVSLDGICIALGRCARYCIRGVKWSTFPFDRGKIRKLAQFMCRLYTKS